MPPDDDWPPPKAVHAPLSEKEKDLLWYGTRHRGHPSSTDGLLEMALMLALDNELAPWPAAKEVAGHLTTENYSENENVAKRLSRKFREIKSRHEEETIQDYMDDDLVFTIIMIAFLRKWQGRLIFPFNPPLTTSMGALGWSLEEELGNGGISRREAFLILLDLLRQEQNREWREEPLRLWKMAADRFRH